MSHCNACISFCPQGALRYRHFPSEAESTADQLNAKLSQVEKNKAKIQSELEAMAQQLDQAQILNGSMEKKAKQFDRIVGEWKGKVAI